MWYGKKSDFIEFEALDEGEVMNECERVEEEEMETDRDFIDDANYDESVADYYAFENVTRTYEEALSDALEGFDYDQGPENYCEEPTDMEIDDFDQSKGRIAKLKSSLVNPQGADNPDSFFYSILYALRYRLTNKDEPCIDDAELGSDVKTEIFDEVNLLRDRLRLDLELMNFENQCFQINRILMKNNFFLRVFELKDKFRYLIKQDSKKQNVIRDLSSCIIEKFNGFNIVRLELDKELRREMSPVDILYKPVKKHTDNIEGFFSREISLAFRTTFSEGEK